MTNLTLDHVWEVNPPEVITIHPSKAGRVFHSRMEEQWGTPRPSRYGKVADMYPIYYDPNVCI